MKKIYLLFLLSIFFLKTRAQSNYKIQVYGAETVEPGRIFLAGD